MNIYKKLTFYILIFLLIPAIFSPGCGKKKDEVKEDTNAADIAAVSAEVQIAEDIPVIPDKTVLLKVAHLFLPEEVNVFSTLAENLGDESTAVNIELFQLPADFIDNPPDFDVAMIPLDWSDKVKDIAASNDLEQPEMIHALKESKLDFQRIYPVSADALVLYRNTDLILEKPDNISDFIRLSRSIDNNGSGFQISRSGYYMLPFVMSFGGGLISRETDQPLILNPPTLQAMRLYLDMINVFGISTAPTEISNARSSFLEGKTAFHMDGLWAAKELIGDFKDTKISIDAVLSGPSGDRGSPLSGRAWIISSDCAEPEIAEKFIQTMIDPVSQAKLADASKLPPAAIAAYDELIEEAYFIQAREALKPAVPFWSKTTTKTPLRALNYVMNAVLEGEMAPENALEEMRKLYINDLKE